MQDGHGVGLLDPTPVGAELPATQTDDGDLTTGATELASVHALDHMLRRQVASEHPSTSCPGTHRARTAAPSGPFSDRRGQLQPLVLPQPSQT